jgi:hypothetical protein
MDEMVKNYVQFTNYHRVLRVSLVVCALMLVFDSGIISESTAKLSNGTQNYLANSIGMTASVVPTELNQFTAKLTEKEQELSSREAALRDREIAIGLNESGQSDYSTYILASILFIMLVLILLNYVLDYLRSKERSLAT